MTIERLLGSAEELRAAGKRREAADVLDLAARLHRPSGLPALQEVLEELAFEARAIRWRYVPAGTFSFGDDHGDLDERPARAVTLPGFFMMEAPISGDDLALAFPNFKSLARYWDGHGSSDWSRLNADYRRGHGRPLAERRPLVAVTRGAADRIAKSLGARLPTEAEWERAARGCFVDARYPWGEAEPTEAIVDGNAVTQRRTHPLPSRAFPPNDYGLFAMAGGVWERCSDSYDLLREPPPQPTSYDVIRGGSFVDDREALRVSFRGAVNQIGLSPVVGVRLVRDLGSVPLD